MLQFSPRKLWHKYAVSRLMSTSIFNSEVIVFGSSTDVGKTIISAGVCRAALKRSRKVCYIKPVQTGDLDEFKVSLYADGGKDMILRTLHHYSLSMSPHLACRINPNERPISNETLISSLEKEQQIFSESDSGGKQLFTVVETAGGVLSPVPSKSLQADIYRTMHLPVILVGDCRLGGISTTLSAYESLRFRDYKVSAIVMLEFQDTQKHGNGAMIREHLQHSSTVFSSSDGDVKGSSLAPVRVESEVPKVFSFIPLPAENLLHDWYAENDEAFTALFDHIVSSSKSKPSSY
jgi:dethiobiotin synthase